MAASTDAAYTGRDSENVGRDLGNVGRDSGNVGCDAGNVGRDSGNVGRDSGNVGRDSGNVGRDSGNVGFEMDPYLVRAASKGEILVTQLLPLFLRHLWLFRSLAVIIQRLLMGKCYKSVRTEGWIQEPRGGFRNRGVDSGTEGWIQ